MNKNIFLCILLVVVFSTTAFAFELPADLMSFYNSNISNVTLSTHDVLLYDVDSTQFYIGFVNLDNISKNITLSINCVSKKCPNNGTLILDHIQTETMPSLAKKAAGIFVYTNQTNIGTYEYEVQYDDGDIQKEYFSIQVISSNFWKQYWYNLLELFGLK